MPDKPQSGDTWYKMEVQCKNELRHLEQRSKMLFQLARQRIFLPREDRADSATLKGLSSLSKTALFVPLNSYISSPSLHAMSYGGHNNVYTKAMVTAKRTIFKKEKNHWFYKQNNSVLMSVVRS